ncbi:HAD family hydrolase [Thermus thermophilus]|uniref:Hydrolase n=1 Tax=Thermus thermophilus TaxID=274 RepID=A0AAD1NZ19_THETH|nr:HAD family phosphatase [Thermus thermophilus]BBL82900.1 hydrolase [Thermus thermophilus]BBL85199.1 hydrolase [Thermus thermophilus]BCZ87550.1 hydrolase [Thermus thermophilus]BCZ89907.1 hydrolase [Thermus thermophilus]BCZ95118.1 hydrolase [Thermus thermophilus]
MRGALLDRDGVLLLLDEKALYRKAVELAARGAGLERSLAALARAVRALNEAVRGLAVRTLEEEEALWRSLVLEVARELRVPPEELLPWRYYRFMRPAPGAERLLRRLKARGLKVGVLSNTLPSLRESLAHHGLAWYVDGFFASCALGVAKPDPRAFLLALEGLGLAPEETLYLDDDPENVEAARRLGLRAEVYAPIGAPGRWA